MIKNAKIMSTILARIDSGSMYFRIYVDIGSGEEHSIGVDDLDELDKGSKTKIFVCPSIKIISDLLDVVGVDVWEQLPGKYIRVSDNGYGGDFCKIGHILKDRWLDFDEIVRG